MGLPYLHGQYQKLNSLISSIQNQKSVTTQKTRREGKNGGRFQQLLSVDVLLLRGDLAAN